MGQVVSFVNYTPTPRYDLLPWTEVRIEEASAEDGTFTTIDTIALDPVDADPSDPAARSFTTQNGTGVDLWYRVVFVDADGDESQPSAPVQNLASTTVASTPYVTAAELARILKIRTPSTEQTAAMERVLSTAAGEIDNEIDRSTPLVGWQLDLVAEVNLERAVEHWRQQESPFGLVGIGSEVGASPTARDSWDRHANKLAPLKEGWPIA